MQGRDKTGKGGGTYLIGSHRALFATMPPLAFDREDPAGSEVVRHIAETRAAAGKAPSKALSVFNYIRKSDRGIIVFDSRLKKWKGADHAAA